MVQKTNKSQQKEVKTMATKITPLRDRILVRRLEEDEKSKGGIIIPDTAKEKPMEGKVTAVGTGRLLDSGEIQPLAVKVGDKILFNKYAGTEITIANEDHLILKEDEVLGIIE